jgi:hypothetical protein
VSAPTRTSHAFRVDNGVALLDLKLGRNVWLSRVDLATLEVSSSENCVLCQATGVHWYGVAVSSLGIVFEVTNDGEGVRPPWTEAHGFGISLATLDEVGHRDFAGLQDAWVAKINELRAEATA